MSPQEPSPRIEGARPRSAYGDPWQAFGYVVAGVGFYGVAGWMLDHWLGTSFLVAIGIIIGAGLGIYLTVNSLRATSERRGLPHGHASTRTEE